MAIITEGGYVVCDSKNSRACYSKSSESHIKQGEFYYPVHPVSDIALIVEAVQSKKQPDLQSLQSANSREIIKMIASGITIKYEKPDTHLFAKTAPLF